MDIPVTKKSIHVFASDFLPFPNCPYTAGAARSWQVISALRSAGHHVTFSMPLSGHLSKLNSSKVLHTFTDEELWSSEHFFEPDVVLNRISPEVAIYCNINCFGTVR